MLREGMCVKSRIQNPGVQERLARLGMGQFGVITRIVPQKPMHIGVNSQGEERLFRHDEFNELWEVD